MSTKDRLHWDATFTARAARPYRAPDPLLLRYAPPATSQRMQWALDLAGGIGQNALWMATQGYQVDLADISRVALERARQEMAERDIRNLNLIQTDVDRWHLNDETGRILHPPALSRQYALIAVFRFLNRDAIPIIKRHIKVGGRIIYQTFNQRHLQNHPDFNRDYLLNDGELHDFFADWRIIFHDEHTHITQLVAIKPRD